MPEDEGKRLTVTVWHDDGRSDTPQLLGAMSFGIHNVLNNTTQVAKLVFRTSVNQVNSN